MPLIKIDLGSTLKILLISTLILVNIAIFNRRYSYGGSEDRAAVIINNNVELATIMPTETAIPTNTKQYHVEHIIQSRFDERSARVATICSIPDSVAASVTKPKDLIDFPSLGLLWCPVFKAGSSNWLDLFCRNNFNKDAYDECTIKTMRRNNPASVYLDSKRPFIYNQMMRKELGLPFMTVRHPMSRFLSAYRDKIELANSKHYYSTIGEEAVSKFRHVENMNHKEKKEQLKEAHEVINSGVLPRNSTNPFLNPPGPTFFEFVKWALLGGMDNHIKPFYMHCSPCAVDYNILRLEKLNEESDYLFSKVERSFLNLDFRTQLNVHGKTDACLYKYYNTLSRSDLTKLYSSFFEVDCELYAYPCKSFLEELLQASESEKKYDLVC